jgi:hypothetical protein
MRHRERLAYPPFDDLGEDLERLVIDNRNQTPEETADQVVRSRLRFEGFARDEPEPQGSQRLAVARARESDVAAVEALLDAAAIWQHSRGVDQRRSGQFGEEI